MLKIFAIVPLIVILSACGPLIDLLLNPAVDEALEEVAVETVKEVEKMEGATGTDNSLKKGKE